MVWYILIATVSLAALGVWRLLERRRERRLRHRKPVDWSMISSADFPEQSDRLAIEIVVPAIAHCFRIAENQVYPDDDINVDYSYPAVWHAITLDDPGEEIIETIREKIEQNYRPWEAATCGPRVRDIITDVSRHLKACSEPRACGNQPGAC
jgi:hypothetical protein